MTKIYFIPGMATKGRIFDLLDLPGFEKVYLEFPEPAVKETLSSYAKKMAKEIPEDETPILVGLSMGGFIAQEIASFRPIKKIILISSIRTGQSFTPYLKYFGKFPIVPFLPSYWVKSVVLKGIHAMGIPKKWKDELLEMIRSFSPNYFKFSAVHLLGWKGAVSDTPIAQIHGTNDLVFPIDEAQTKYILRGGSHMMIANYHVKISQAILQEISE